MRSAASALMCAMTTTNASRTSTAIKAATFRTTANAATIAQADGRNSAVCAWRTVRTVGTRMTAAAGFTARRATRVSNGILEAVATVHQARHGVAAAACVT